MNLIKKETIFSKDVLNNELSIYEGIRCEFPLTYHIFEISKLGQKPGSLSKSFTNKTAIVKRIEFNNNVFWRVSLGVGSLRISNSDHLYRLNKEYLTYMRKYKLNRINDN